MNLFYLDKNLDKCAEYHIDKHVSKMQLEAAQLLSAALWVDKYIGYVPDKLNSDQLKIINEHKKLEPDIESRTFTRYLPTHINHPSSIWVRTSLENYEWTQLYIAALDSECSHRGYKSPSASFLEMLRLPEPENIPSLGFTEFQQCVPVAMKADDPVEAYRLYYRIDKKDIASWKNRNKPTWW